MITVDSRASGTPAPRKRILTRPRAGIGVGRRLASIVALAAAAGSSGCANEVVEKQGSALDCSAVGCSCNGQYSIGFVQNVDGSNFEIVAPAAAGGLVHYNRDDDNFARDNTALAWSSPDSFGSGDVNGVALIQSSFTTGSKHHLEAVYVAGDKLFGAWRNDGGGYAWNIASAPIASGVRGTPGFIQSQQGTVGNFELVVPLASGGIAHYFRDNDSGQGWVRSAVFGSGLYDAAVMIQSSIGASGSDGGNLEVLARKGTDLYHFFRGQSGTALTWSAGKKIASGVTGSPGFIQSSTGTVGNFEMITPLLAGGMAHFYRDNDSATPNWVGPQQILDMTSGAVSAVSIIESRYPGGPIEYVARKDGELYWGNRDPSSLEWQGPYSFSSQPCCDPRVMGKMG